jgi:hypothetical protein
MQKAYSLQPEEIRQAQQLQNEQRDLLAQLGSMSLEKKRISKRIPQIEEDQRKLVRSAVARVGVDQFSAARIDGSNLILEVPDQAAPAPPGASDQQSAAHTNGAA